MKFNGTYTNAPMGEGKAELDKFLEEHNRLHALHKDLFINEQLLKTDKENELVSSVTKYQLGNSLTEKKAEFFQHLNKVLDNKLVKPSIIVEYVNQYQRGEIK